MYGALAYNGEKINKEEGKLLATNKIFDDGSGKTDIANALRDFQRYLSPHVRTEKPVVHISLNPHPDDVLTDVEMENIAREYLERMGYGDQPYMVYKHEDIDRHHMHIVTIRVDENGKCLDSRYNYRKSKAITRDLEERYHLHKADRKQHRVDSPLRKVDVSQGDVKKQVANTVKSLCATYKFQSLGEYRALTAPKAYSTVHALERTFPPMPCRSISLCHTRMSNRYRLPFRRRKALLCKSKSIKTQACSTNTAAVLDSWLEAVLPTSHKKQHLTKNCAERKRSAKVQDFNHQKQDYNGTRRRFEGTGENHGFSPCHKHHFGNDECILVLLRGNAHCFCLSRIWAMPRCISSP